ncbi:Oxygen-independent coproporphyrinogen III oxidase [compost metagenome]
MGLGVSAISQVGDLYCQNNAQLNDYQGALDAGLLATERGLLCDQDDRVRRAVIQQLICEFELDFDGIESRFNIEFRGYFADIWPQLQRMHEDRLIDLSDKRIDVLPAGRLLVRSLCMLFDAYLPAQNQQRFSRVI